MTTTASTAAATAAKTYNLTGSVADVSLGTDRKGRPFASFSLLRTNGKTVKCMVFAAHIDKVKEAVEQAQGGNVKLFGRFDRRQFTGSDGKEHTAMRFHALWAGQPKAKGQEQEPEQQAAA